MELILNVTVFVSGSGKGNVEKLILNVSVFVSGSGKSNIERNWY